MAETKVVITQLLLIFVLAGSSGLFANSNIAAEVEYFYAKDGTIIGRAVNGVRSNFEYDAKGQLLSVKDAKTGELRESYTYDPAGNILSKTVYGEATTYTYDAANQLVNATANGTKTTYAYDAAGRLIRAGSKSYRYGFKDKVLEVRDGTKTRARFSYYMDGQLKQAKYTDRTENFMWDGLALVKRDSVNFINEPYVTGGNPVLAGNSVMFNDMLGSTLSVDGKSVDMTAFGDSDDAAAMFTGKPHVDELGHVFLFRNYRAELGKWQTADPLGYPDGWNQLAYCNNEVIDAIDWMGNITFSMPSPSAIVRSVCNYNVLPEQGFNSPSNGFQVLNIVQTFQGSSNESDVMFYFNDELMQPYIFYAESTFAHWTGVLKNQGFGAAHTFEFNVEIDSTFFFSSPRIENEDGEIFLVYDLWSSYGASATSTTNMAGDLVTFNNFGRLESVVYQLRVKE